MRWLRLGLVGVLLLLGSAVVAGTAVGQAQKQINVVGPPYGFSPPGGAIASGQTLLWENHTGVEHNATSPDFSVRIPAGDGQRSSVVTITGQPRTITYQCTIHGFTGTLQVTAASGSSPPAPPPPPPPAGTPTTARSTATTVRGATTITTRAGGSTTTTAGFEVLAPTTTVASTTTTARQMAIKKKGSGTDGFAVAALAIALVAVVGGGGYGLFRLGARRAAAAAPKK